ncbi:MAG: hypothetical protein AAB089_06450, partial [Nitrospirota bacterium]
SGIHFFHNRAQKAKAKDEFAKQNLAAVKVELDEFKSDAEKEIARINAMSEDAYKREVRAQGQVWVDGLVEHARRSEAPDTREAELNAELEKSVASASKAKAIENLNEQLKNKEAGVKKLEDRKIDLRQEILKDESRRAELVAGFVQAIYNSTMFNSGKVNPETGEIVGKDITVDAAASSLESSEQRGLVKVFKLSNGTEIGLLPAMITLNGGTNLIVPDGKENLSIGDMLRDEQGNQWMTVAPQEDKDGFSFRPWNADKYPAFPAFSQVEPGIFLREGLDVRYEDGKVVEILNTPQAFKLTQDGKTVEFNAKFRVDGEGKIVLVNNKTTSEIEQKINELQERQKQLVQDQQAALGRNNSRSANNIGRDISRLEKEITLLKIRKSQFEKEQAVPEDSTAPVEAEVATQTAAVGTETAGTGGTGTEAEVQQPSAAAEPPAAPQTTADSEQPNNNTNKDGLSAFGGFLFGGVIGVWLGTKFGVSPTWFGIGGGIAGHTLEALSRLGPASVIKGIGAMFGKKGSAQSPAEGQSSQETAPVGQSQQATAPAGPTTFGSVVAGSTSQISAVMNHINGIINPMIGVLDPAHNPLSKLLINGVNAGLSPPVALAIISLSVIIGLLLMRGNKVGALVASVSRSVANAARSTVELLKLSVAQSASLEDEVKGQGAESASRYNRVKEVIGSIAAAAKVIVLDIAAKIHSLGTVGAAVAGKLSQIPGSHRAYGFLNIFAKGLILVIIIFAALSGYFDAPNEDFAPLLIGSAAFGFGKGKKKGKEEKKHGNNNGEIHRQKIAEARNIVENISGEHLSDSIGFDPDDVEKVLSALQEQEGLTEEDMRKIRTVMDVFNDSNIKNDKYATAIDEKMLRACLDAIAGYVGDDSSWKNIWIDAQKAVTGVSDGVSDPRMDAVLERMAQLEELAKGADAKAEEADAKAEEVKKREDDRTKLTKEAIRRMEGENCATNTDDRRIRAGLKERLELNGGTWTGVEFNAIRRELVNEYNATHSDQVQQESLGLLSADRLWELLNSGVSVRIEEMLDDGNHHIVLPLSYGVDEETGDRFIKAINMNVADSNKERSINIEDLDFSKSGIVIRFQEKDSNYIYDNEKISDEYYAEELGGNKPVLGQSNSGSPDGSSNGGLGDGASGAGGDKDDDKKHEDGKTLPVQKPDSERENNAVPTDRLTSENPDESGKAEEESIKDDIVSEYSASESRAPPQTIPDIAKELRNLANQSINTELGKLLNNAAENLEQLTEAEQAAVDFNRLAQIFKLLDKAIRREDEDYGIVLLNKLLSVIAMRGLKNLDRSLRYARYLAHLIGLPFSYVAMKINSIIDSLKEGEAIIAETEAVAKVSENVEKATAGNNSSVKAEDRASISDILNNVFNILKSFSGKYVSGVGGAAINTIRDGLGALVYPSYAQCGIVPYTTSEVVVGSITLGILAGTYLTFGSSVAGGVGLVLIAAAAVKRIAGIASSLAFGEAPRNDTASLPTSSSSAAEQKDNAGALSRVINSLGIGSLIAWARGVYTSSRDAVKNSKFAKYVQVVIENISDLAPPVIGGKGNTAINQLTITIGGTNDNTTENRRNKGNHGGNFKSILYQTLKRIARSSYFRNVKFEDYFSRKAEQLISSLYNLIKGQVEFGIGFIRAPPAAFAHAFGAAVVFGQTNPTTSNSS